MHTRLLDDAAWVRTIHYAGAMPLTVFSRAPRALCALAVAATDAQLRAASARLDVVENGSAPRCSYPDHTPQQKVCDHHDHA